MTPVPTPTPVEQTPEQTAIRPLLLAVSPGLNGITLREYDTQGHPLPERPMGTYLGRNYYHLTIATIRGLAMIRETPVNPEPWLEQTLLDILYPLDWDLPPKLCITLWFVPGWNGDLKDRDTLHRLPSWCHPFNLRTIAQTYGQSGSRLVEVRDYLMHLNVQGGSYTASISGSLHDWIKAVESLAMEWVRPNPGCMGISLVPGWAWPYDQDRKLLGMGEDDHGLIPPMYPLGVPDTGKDWGVWPYPDGIHHRGRVVPPPPDDEPRGGEGGSK